MNVNHEVLIGIMLAANYLPAHAYGMVFQMEVESELAMSPLLLLDIQRKFIPCGETVDECDQRTAVVTVSLRCQLIVKTNTKGKCNTNNSTETQEQE